MRYEILYKGAYPIVRCHLDKGEMMKAESDAMVAMSPTIEVTSKQEGGLLKGLMRSVLSDESLFYQYLTAKGGDGTVLFAHAMPGDITAVSLSGSTELWVQKGGFLACENTLSLETKSQGFLKGMLSGEGWFLSKMVGRGTVFLSSYGAIHPIELGRGEEVIIDNAHLVAWDDTCKYEVEQASSGFFRSLTSGEMLVTRLTGPGRVYIQTRNPNAFESWIRSLIPPSSN